MSLATVTPITRHSLIAPGEDAMAAPAARSRVSGEPQLRLTRRGQVVVFTFFLVLALLATMMVASWANASKDAPTPVQVRVITVQPGDTLYGIAGRMAEPGQVRDMVHYLQQLNALPTTDLQAGQRLAIPAK